MEQRWAYDKPFGSKNKLPKNSSIAEQLGGYELHDWEADDYRAEHYSNKSHHFERSTVHQPSHEAHRGTIYFR